MSGTNSFYLAIFMGGTFAAAFVTSVAGFAFGMVTAGIWLHVMSPAQSSVLIVAYALLIQGHAVWNLRHAFNFQRLKFLLLGTTMGIPAGIAALGWISASTLRIVVGAALILFCLYNLARLKLPKIKKANRIAETAVGLLNGIFGATTGLAGIAPMILEWFAWLVAPRAASCVSADRSRDLSDDHSRLRRRRPHHHRHRAPLCRRHATADRRIVARLDALREAR
jgi:uncharacterized membrane protein YfcA